MSQAVPALTLSEDELVELAGTVARHTTSPACFALFGDLGAGKSTFARALIRALMRDPSHDVPSPTFSLRQDYASPSGPIVHFDFYRLSHVGEVDELGFAEAAENTIMIVEWPDRAGDSLPPDRLDVFLTESASKDKRDVRIVGRGRHGSQLSTALIAALDPGMG